MLLTNIAGHLQSLSHPLSTGWSLKWKLATARHKKEPNKYKQVSGWHMLWLYSRAALPRKHQHNGTFATPNQVHLSRWTTRLMEWHVPSQPGRNRFKPDLTCMGLPACGHNASTAALFTVPGCPLVHSKGKPPTIDLTVPAIKIKECCCNWWRLSTTSEMSCRAPPTHVQYVNLEWLAKTSSHKSPTYYTNY